MLASLKTVAIVAFLAAKVIAIDHIECTVKAYKLSTDSADPMPTAPAEVKDILASFAETPEGATTPSVTDMCNTPEVTGSEGSIFTSYMSTSSAWAERNACAWSSILAECDSVSLFNQNNLAADKMCNTFKEKLEKATGCATADVGPRETGAVAAAALLGGVAAVANIAL